MDLLPKVSRTEGRIADFDPSKIYESILKETGMSEKDTRRITELAVRRIISSGMKFLSGPHIREIVCSILSEQHFEEERKLYTRIGMPLMDYEEVLEEIPTNKPYGWKNPEKIHHWSADQIAEEYAHLRILKNEESKSHLAGDIHINGLNYFVLRPFSQVWDPRFILEHGLPPIENLKNYYKYNPAKNLKSALYQLSKWLEMIQNEFYGIQGFNFINTFLAPFVLELTEEKIRREVQNFIYENNLLSLILGREVPPISLFSSISIIEELMNSPAITPGGKIVNIYGNYHDQSTRFFKALLLSFKEISQKHPLISIPVHNIFLNHNFINLIEDIFPRFWEEFELISSSYFSTNNPNSFRFANLKHLSKSNYYNFGILQNISLNLPRYAYTTKDEDKFIELLISKLILCSNILLKKYNIIKKRIHSNHLPLCSIIIEGNPIFNLKNQGLSFSLVGLNEAIKYITNYDIHETLESIKLAKRIMVEINKLFSDLSNKNNKIFLLSENSSQKAIKRFTELDLKEFPKKAKLASKNMTYTNSVHFHQSADINLLDKLKIQEEFHKSIQEGAITFISFSELKKSGLNIKDFLTKISMDSTISNLKFYIKEK
ncbi:MAG: anaerobic ribonucleoside-triphosphate reductase [Candidatus Odinarchaeota archaeon]